MTNVKDRFNQTKAAYKITNKALADESGLSIQTVINQCGGKYNMSLELIQALIRLAPSVDVRWLITGDHQDERISKLENEIANIRAIIGNVSR